MATSTVILACSLEDVETVKRANQWLADEDITPFLQTFAKPEELIPRQRPLREPMAATFIVSCGTFPYQRFMDALAGFRWIKPHEVGVLYHEAGINILASRL